MAARGWLNRATVEGALAGVMHANGYVADEGVDAVAATIKSGLDAGEKAPHPDLPDRDEPAVGPQRGQRRWAWGATAGDDRKMNNEPLEREPTNNDPLEREPIDRVRARLEALLKANAAPRCGARSKRTGKPCQGAAMPNGRCKLHGGKSTGPRTAEGLERSRRANWKHGHFSREAKAERSRLRAAILVLRDLRDSI